MAGIKSLGKDTIYYGLSSIVGRFLNWCLVPLYTRVFADEVYGEVTYIYSIVALVMIFLIYGMETGFFRFANRDDADPMRVYSTALISLATTSTIFIVAVFVFINPLSRAMLCPDNHSYVYLMGVTVAIDAFSAMPFSYLRYDHRPLRFALLRCINIGINIGLNLFFILLCPWLYRVCPQSISWFYDPSFGIGYIFLANFISSALTLLMLLPELRGFRWTFDRQLWRRMIVYSFPILLVGIAGIMNQNLDKILLPYLLDSADAKAQLGIYGACYKIAIVMVMFLQAFRFAYEPFIFSQAKEKGESQLQSYRDAMKWFVIFCMIVFLGVMFYMDLLKYFIAPAYFSGLKVVPIIMIAEFFFGVFFNLSLWYKLTDRTHWGIWFTLLGLAFTIGLNVLLVPKMGYMGCAWAAFSCYGVMMVASYVVGRWKYPIGYNVPRLSIYFFSALALYGLSLLIATGHALIDLPLRTVLLVAYIYMCLRIEKVSLRQLLPIRRK